MGELRLREGSDQVLAEWWDSDKPKEGDRELVAEVLCTLRQGTWRTRWFYTEDLADPRLLPLISIQPRDHLVVMVRFWPAENPPEVQLLGIVDIAELPEFEHPEED